LKFVKAAKSDTVTQIGDVTPQWSLETISTIALVISIVKQFFSFLFRITFAFFLLEWIAKLMGNDDAGSFWLNFTIIAQACYWSLYFVLRKLSKMEGLVTDELGDTLELVGDNFEGNCTCEIEQKVDLQKN
jgi:hypothetical protein